MGRHESGPIRQQGVKELGPGASTFAQLLTPESGVTAQAASERLVAPPVDSLNKYSSLLYVSTNADAMVETDAPLMASDQYLHAVTEHMANLAHLRAASVEGKVQPPTQSAMELVAAVQNFATANPNLQISGETDSDEGKMHERLARAQLEDALTHLMNVVGNPGFEGYPQDTGPVPIYAYNYLDRDGNINRDEPIAAGVIRALESILEAQPNDNKTVKAEDTNHVVSEMSTTSTSLSEGFDLVYVIRENCGSTSCNDAESRVEPPAVKVNQIELYIQQTRINPDDTKPQFIAA